MLRKDAILDASATFGQFFAIIDDGRGHREPIRAQAEHRFSLEIYRKLRSTPLAVVPHAVPSVSNPAEQAPIETLWQQLRRQQPTKEREDRVKQLARLLAAKEAAERVTPPGDQLF